MLLHECIIREKQNLLLCRRSCYDDERKRQCSSSWPSLLMVVSLTDTSIQLFDSWLDSGCCTWEHMQMQGCISAGVPDWSVHHLSHWIDFNVSLDRFQCHSVLISLTLCLILFLKLLSDAFCTWNGSFLWLICGFLKFSLYWMQSAKLYNFTSPLLLLLLLLFALMSYDKKLDDQTTCALIPSFFLLHFSFLFLLLLLLSSHLSWCNLDKALLFSTPK